MRPACAIEDRLASPSPRPQTSGIPIAVDRLERILVVDDDSVVRSVLISFFGRKGYRVLEAHNGQEAMDLIKREKPALVILDIEMPEMGGLTVLKRLREAGNVTPVLIASSRSGVDDRVLGLTSGADDYLPKPFDLEELLARVQALLRRRTGPSKPVARLQLGDVEVNLTERVARTPAGTVRLSRTECSILDLLARNAGKPVAREELFDVVWGYTYLPSSRTLDTHVWRLRQKLGDSGDTPRWIRNISGVGYQLDCTSAPAALPAG
jgi:DNA-binding response OmpR family regulator